MSEGERVGRVRGEGKEGEWKGREGREGRGGEGMKMKAAVQVKKLSSVLF